MWHSALESNRREERKEDLRLTELREAVIVLFNVRRIEHVSSKGEEADDQSKDELGDGARRLEEDGQADDGQLAYAPAGGARGARS